MIIDIAGIKTRIELEKNEINKKLRARYKAFFSPHLKENYCIKVKFTNKSKNIGEPEIKKEKDGFTINRADFEFKLKGKRGMLICRPNIYSFDSFLRVFYSLILLKNRTLLIHGCGFRHKGKNYCFIGKSGSGKSTICRLMQDRAIIFTDELICLKIEKKIKVYSSPFWGELRPGGVNYKGNLNHFYILKKSDKARIKNIDIRNFMKTALRCAMNFSRSTKEAQNIINLLFHLRKAINPKYFYFDRNLGFLKLL
jgi:hypothetical protein